MGHERADVLSPRKPTCYVMVLKTGAEVLASIDAS